MYFLAKSLFAAALLTVTPTVAAAVPREVPAPAPAPTRTCDAAHKGRFDFWIGSWEVTPTDGGPVLAHSRIEPAANGCAVRETWMPLDGGGGSSISAYDARSGKWRQAWTDAAGSWVLFEGGWVGDAMVLSGLWPGAGAGGQDAIVRMTYTRSGDDQVRQLGEASTDDGQSWSPSFDLTYRRLPDPSD